MRRWRRVHLVSLCFHRFAGPANGAAGHDLDAISDALGWLKRAGFVFADLETVVRGLLSGVLPERSTVVVTIDDGYADLADAVPVFARHGCPVSVFLATGFLDSRDPLWWDQIQLLLARAEGSAHLHDIEGITWSGVWRSHEERVHQGELLIEQVKRTREPARESVIKALAAQVGGALPQETPGFAPLSWDDVRALERDGVRFGPHTHTHPILSALGPQQARFEIETSWARLREEVRRPLSVFAYPDGTPWAYSERDSQLVRSAGIEAAVTMDARWVLPELERLDPFRLGRIGFQASLTGLQGSVLRLGRARD